jgi:hypothetical protein
VGTIIDGKGRRPARETVYGPERNSDPGGTGGTPL